MNYIKEINTFYDWLETNSLSTSGIALWHALMHINNKAGWVEEFGVATSVLCIKTGLADRTIRNARNELKQKGRIDFKSRKGSQSAIYKMISLVDDLPETITGNKNRKDKRDDLSEIDAGNHADNHADKCAGNHATLYKLNKTKLDLFNNTTAETVTSNIEARKEGIFDEELKELAQLYQKCGFNTNGFTPDWLTDLKDRFGFEWVKNAIFEAEKQGARSKAYVEKILNNWNKWGGMKLSNDNAKNDNNKSASNGKKNRFHNFEQRSSKYSNDQLEDIAMRKKEEYLKKIKGEKK